MAPKEHQLSQRVLEFLIANQDWFMGDVPPPPRQDSIMVKPTPQTTGSEDIFVIPSDTDEEQLEGGWKLIEKSKSLGRRRTIADHPGAAMLADKFTTEPTTLTPVASLPESPDEQYFGTGAAGVKRSVTAPSRKGDTEPRLLVKKRLESRSGRISP